MYIDQGSKVALCLESADLSESTYHYKSKAGRKGKRASEYTRMTDGRVVPNDQVVAAIRKLLNQEFVDYGYIKVTHYLKKRLGYLINKKKVYRLMKEHKLLNSRRKVDRSPRLWVEDLVPNPTGCFDHLEIDIKYIYVGGTRSNILQLTVLDVKTRYVLGYCQGYSIKQDDVIRLFNKIFATIRFPTSYYVRRTMAANLWQVRFATFLNPKLELPMNSLSLPRRSRMHI